MTNLENVQLLDTRIQNLLNEIQQVEITQIANIKAKTKLENDIQKIAEESANNVEALDIATHAIEILRQVSDEAVSSAYKFLEENLNTALARMFSNTTRHVTLREYTRNNQYPQLEIELTVAGGKKRSLKADSGHGLAQIVSLLSILCLIVITNSRRILVMDEIISGLSAHNREIVSEILWSFTEIGFQFIVNDHGFIPVNSHVYHLEMVGDVSHIKEDYIESEGIYLNGTLGQSDEDYVDTDEQS